MPRSIMNPEVAIWRCGRRLLLPMLALLTAAMLLAACGSGVSREELDTTTSQIRDEVKALEEQVSA